MSSQSHCQARLSSLSLIIAPVHKDPTLLICLWSILKNCAVRGLDKLCSPSQALTVEECAMSPLGEERRLRGEG